MQVCPHGVQEVWRRVGDDAYVPAVLRPRFWKLSQRMVYGIISEKS
jgi:hypothetical protein